MNEPRATTCLPYSSVFLKRGDYPNKRGTNEARVLASSKLPYSLVLLKREVIRYNPDLVQNILPYSLVLLKLAPVGSGKTTALKKTSILSSSSETNIDNIERVAGEKYELPYSLVLLKR
jgi:hypothetical protein